MGEPKKTKAQRVQDLMGRGDRHARHARTRVEQKQVIVHAKVRGTHEDALAQLRRPLPSRSKNGVRDEVATKLRNRAKARRRTA